MKVYMAGPMTGIPFFNYPHFRSVAEMLREEGFKVISPIEMDSAAAVAAALASPNGTMEEFNAAFEGETPNTWGDFLSRDVKLIADDGIEAIVVLHGWEKSRGARLETFVANAMCGLPVYSWANLAMHSADPSRWQPISPLVLVKAWADKPDISFHSVA